MKSFISKNWKRIFYAITGFFIVIDLFFIITSPATISQDFLKYGPDIKADIFDTTETIAEEIDEPSSSGEFITQISDDTGFSPDLVKGLIIFGIIFVIVFALSGTIEGTSAAKKKK